MTAPPIDLFLLVMNVSARSRPSSTARRLSAAVLCASFALGLAACGKQDAASDKGAAEKGKAGAGGPPPAVPVTVQRAELQRVPISLEAVGQAEGSREVEVRARVQGILERRLYTEGAPVGAGTTLFIIDRAPYEIAVAQAKAALQQEIARQELAQREADRMKGLAGNRAISQREYDEAVSNQKQSAAAIEAAKAKLAEAQLNLSWTSVKAPIAGITGRAVKSEGSLVQANTDLLTQLTQVNPIWIRFSLADSDYERVRGAEKRAQVRILNQDGSVAAGNGRLNFAGSTVDPKLGTVQLRAEFVNPVLKWLPGQFAKVEILAGEQEAFVIPQAAVVQTEQARMVWVVGDESKVAMRPVQTANWSGANWVITGGLKPGELVVVDNLIKMRPGATVKPQMASALPQQPGGAGGAPAQAPAGASPAATSSASADTSAAAARSADRKGAAAPTGR